MVTGRRYGEQVPPFCQDGGQDVFKIDETIGVGGGLVANLQRSSGR